MDLVQHGCEGCTIKRVVKVEYRDVRRDLVKCGVAVCNLDFLATQPTVGTANIILRDFGQIGSNLDAKHALEWITCCKYHCSAHTRAIIKEHMISWINCERTYNSAEVGIVGRRILLVLIIGV